VLDHYAIAVRQFQQQILPLGFNPTTVWGYGAAFRPNTFNYPAFTIEAEHDTPVRVTWINDLMDSRGEHLPHLLPVDQTLHWANPPASPSGRDQHGTDPTPYRGPVPIVTHLHGAHTTDDSDGFAEAWYLPNARNIPSGYARTGTWYNTFREKFRERHGGVWRPGTATFQYPNDQAATTLWYHDHVLGMTRLNVYAGPAGFYLLRGGRNDLPPHVLPGQRRHWATRLERAIMKSRSPSRTARSTLTAPCSTPIIAPSSRAWSKGSFKSLSFPIRRVMDAQATFRQSGTPSSSATRWS
jgi:bilirubin oxidase